MNKLQRHKPSTSSRAKRGKRFHQELQLPPFLRDLVGSPPKTGQGVHRWLFQVARHLHAHLPAGEIVTLLENAVSNCGRYVPPSEIIDAVKNSVTCAWQPSGGRLHQPAIPKWPTINQEQREAIERDNGGLVDLWELSRPRIEDSAQHVEEIIDQLFPGNPLLCCGRSHSDFDTRSREEWRGELARLQFIVPSAMTALVGKTRNGRESKHSSNNTGTRRYLVCEFDAGTIDEHAAILLHLARYAPLVCAVFSGSKSLHGWFFVHGQPEEKVLKFFRYAVSLGADPMTWTRSQFVRMPDGRRSSGERQTVFFLNFKPMEATR
jgi:hypothetical protein